MPHVADGSLAAGAERFPALANARVRARALHARGLSGSLLDIGCGVGYFVLAAGQFFDAKGIDIEETAVHSARKIAANVTRGDALSAEFGDAAYDVVTLWDVFSGFIHPIEAAGALLQRVKPGGHLIMTVPDANSPPARLGGRRWPLMIPPGNMQFFTAESARRLFAHFDVGSIELEHQTKWVSVDFLVHKLLRAVGMFEAARWRRPIPKHWKIPVNLRDIMTIIVRKGAPGARGLA